MAGNPPSRHLWVGGLPEEIGEAEIKELFTKYGKVEGVKILPQRYPNQGVAAFVDFYDVRSAVEAKEAKIIYGGCDLRTNFKTKSTERFDKYGDHLPRREEYGKEPPIYSAKRVISPSPPPENEKERNNKDKEKSRGKDRYICGMIGRERRLCWT
jgi:RNA recognition motif-containing protein